ncbi:MAG: carbohydrate binding family 9 domain-containing protein [Gemmatimonadota bacterium]|nr:MAG: carbohydrate binding family 9 domain-containing protein [Gemmatimonadota bacterium]
MIRVVKSALVLNCLLPVALLPAAAQLDGGAGYASDEISAPAIPRVAASARAGEIDIDGRLVEAAWQAAIPATRFVQGEPVEGAPPESRTEVRVLFDKGALYIAARMYEDDPRDIGDQLVRRDENGQYDYFEVSLDPNNDRRTGYRFRVSAAGVQRDVYLYDDVREDEAWDGVWDSAVRRDSLGWTAELRIPLSQVRYIAADSLQSWGINFTRRRLVTNEITYLALESRITHGKVSVFGKLDGLQLPRGARRVELRPYVLANARTAPAVVGDPFFDGSEVGTRAGLDMRLGLGASHTLDVTVNPDFGQVEVDPAVINLSAFETFFREKRPFFVEDAQIFDFRLSGRQNTLFYSRRIGREPHGSAPSDVDFTSIPTQTSILGAAKLTGRTASGFSIGALAALTDQESGYGYREIAGQTKFIVEPRSQYGALRLQQDFRNGGTQIGTMVTVTNRELPSDGAFDYLPSNAYAAGIDFEHNWGGPRSRNWALTGYVAGTVVKGSPIALLGIQQRSNHYFQRPDATRASLDSSATQLSGIEWRLEFERQSAKHWTGGIWVGEVTPGFEVNDLGFSQSGEKLDIGGRIQYQEIKPGKVLRNYRLSLWTFHNFRHEALDDIGSWNSWTRAHKTGAVMINANGEFLNYWGINLRARYSPQSMSDVATRGGPLMVDPASTSLTVGAYTDRRKMVSLRPSITYEARHLGGYSWRAGFEVEFRPTPSWEIQLSPQYSAQLDPAQYVTRTGDVGYDPTYGRRYLFSDLERRSFSVQTRLNVAFSPALTLQLYAQPLVSSGDYLTYKQLERSESFAFDTFEEGEAQNIDDEVSCSGGRTCVSEGRRYVDFEGDGTTDHSFSDKDFNFRSLRLNAVLRWEFRPGSTVFLVWQQSRSNRENVGSFELGRDVSRLWGAEPENMFIVKFTYWLGL